METRSQEQEEKNEKHPAFGLSSGFWLLAFNAYEILVTSRKTV